MQNFLLALTILACVSGYCHAEETVKVTVFKMKDGTEIRAASFIAAEGIYSIKTLDGKRQGASKNDVLSVVEEDINVATLTPEVQAALRQNRQAQLNNQAERIANEAQEKARKDAFFQKKAEDQQVLGPLGAKKELARKNASVAWNAVEQIKVTLRQAEAKARELQAAAAGFQAEHDAAQTALPGVQQQLAALQLVRPRDKNEAREIDSRRSRLNSEVSALQSRMVFSAKKAGEAKAQSDQCAAAIQRASLDLAQAQSALDEATRVFNAANAEYEQERAARK